MSKYLDDMHESMRNIREISMRLGELGHAFYITGNNVVADELGDISSQLMDEQKKIGNAISTDLHDRTKEMWDGTGRILEAMIVRGKRNGTNDN